MKNEGPARMVAFGWLALQGKILMMGNLIRKKMIVGNLCPLCLLDRSNPFELEGDRFSVTWFMFFAFWRVVSVFVFWLLVLVDMLLVLGVFVVVLVFFGSGNIFLLYCFSLV